MEAQGPARATNGANRSALQKNRRSKEKKKKKHWKKIQKTAPQLRFNDKIIAGRY